MALALDRGTPQLSSTVPIVIDVGDINDNPPKFESSVLEYYIKENSPLGSEVGQILANDPDEGENAVVTYSIIGRLIFYILILLSFRYLSFSIFLV